MSDLDRDAITWKLDNKGITAVNTIDQIDGSEIATITLQDAAILLAALEEAEIDLETKSVVHECCERVVEAEREREAARAAWYDAAKMVKFWKGRAESAERRIAAVYDEGRRHGRRDDHNSDHWTPNPYRSALHPVAETTEKGGE